MAGRLQLSSKYKNWREYQETVADVFRNLGCRAEVEKKVTGVRGSHEVDVFVTFRKFGRECRWIVECKLWSKRVDKSEVLTLQSIVQDIGADRGVIFTEIGFQSGAHGSAQKTDILLQCSLENFRQTAQLDVSRVPFIFDESGEADVPPVHVFPGDYHPHHLLKYDGRLFVSNWGAPQKGNIAIVNPEARAIEGIIELDKYESSRTVDGRRMVVQHPPGNIACADGKLFVGQVFSDFVLVIDIETQSIIRRIPVPGGGEGAIAASADERHVYFASNRIPYFFVIDSATYQYSEVNYPPGGRGSLCVLPNPNGSILYIGIQRGGNPSGIAPQGGGSFLAVYNLTRRRYVGKLYLAEIKGGRSDDSTPHCLTYDEQHSCLFVGLFQSMRGIAGSMRWEGRSWATFASHDMPGTGTSAGLILSHRRCTEASCSP